MVHQFRLFDKNIVLDVNSNALYVFDDLASGLLMAWSDKECDFDKGLFAALANKHGESDTKDAAFEISELIKSGRLKSPDELLSGGSLTYETVFKSLCLHLAHDCNMRCGYCFAAAGSFGLQRELMSFETARAAIDFAVSNSGKRKNIEIDFFGGEPLLNFDVLKRAVDYARSIEKDFNKKFRFTLTTNGLLIDDEKALYINDNMDNLVLSIDGRKEVNDSMRKSIDGSGTYDTLVKNFRKVLNNRDRSWYIRGTYTSFNKDFASDVLHIADLGFDQLSIEPVVSPTNRSLDFKDGDLLVLLSEYERLAFEMRERERAGKPIHFFHFNVDLEQGPCAARRLKGCGAGYEYAAVAPNGDIYPCHQFVGIDEFKLGSVTDGVIHKAVSTKFAMSGTLNNEKCFECWAKYFCGGGCAANAWNYNRDIHVPNDFYCSLLKKRIECALWLMCERGAEENT